MIGSVYTMPLVPLRTVSEISTGKHASAEVSGKQSFEETLKSVMQDLKKTDQILQNVNSSERTEISEEIEKIMTFADRAAYSTDMSVQIFQKAVEAYNEIINMQI